MNHASSENLDLTRAFYISRAALATLGWGGNKGALTYCALLVLPWALGAHSGMPIGLLVCFMRAEEPTASLSPLCLGPSEMREAAVPVRIHSLITLHQGR